MLRNQLVRKFREFSVRHDTNALVKNPNDLKRIIHLSNNLLELVEPKDMDALADALWKDEQVVRAVEERYRVRYPSLAALGKYPVGSLGRAFCNHLQENKITLESLKGPDVKDDLTYLTTHLYETHDLWHTITGFGISIADELGLQAFVAAQFPSQFSYFLLSGGLMNTAIYDFQDRFARMDAITKGWRMGQKAKHLFGIRWEGLLKEPISSVRGELGIVGDVLS